MKLVALVAVVACGKPAKTVDWSACDAAIHRAAPWPELVAACPVCDFDPILRWDQVPIDKLAAAMTACDAFCTGGAKDRFTNTIDKARGASESPWRYLGEACGTKIGLPADLMRFASPPWFVLDRLGRLLAARGTPGVDKLEIAVPPRTISGVAPQVPEGKDTIALDLMAPAWATVTMIGDDVFVGRWPRVRLDRDGIHLVPEYPLYPGVAGKDLGAVGAKDDWTIAVVAPAGMPASKLAAAITGRGRFRLVETDGVLPGGWPSYRLHRVAITASSITPVEIDDQMTVTDLARRLDALHVTDVSLTRRVSP